MTIYQVLWRMGSTWHILFGVCWCC